MPTHPLPASSGPTPPSIHLVCGPLAAGKSTLARQLAAQHQAVHLAVDDWMQQLFHDDRPAQLDLAWVAPRVVRCRALMWHISRQVLATGRGVVLELGLLRQQDRADALAQAAATGHPSRLHLVDAEVQVRRQRVAQRNAERGETFAFEVTPAMFDLMEGLFERPSPEELQHG